MPLIDEWRGRWQWWEHLITSWSEVFYRMGFDDSWKRLGVEIWWVQ